MNEFKKIKTPSSPYYHDNKMHDFEVEISEGPNTFNPDTCCPVDALLIKLKLNIWGQFDGHLYKKSEADLMYSKLSEEIIGVLRPQIEAFVNKVAPFSLGTE